ncbi:Ca-activated chloride channel family protein [Cytobacillus eiseniae]|uniref:Ca-activated chloride channel family protein n=1 Tax=Cytobacillus eiseniae TaxID=762947 RepID=A0ABS4RGB4_9BACI|nr:VWA domain-containing protein [Cytobacillus eiseniae]MBP2241759.1 Ca-activated chloride channel family protein [Cytobacillus eiseniae]
MKIRGHVFIMILLLSCFLLTACSEKKESDSQPDTKEEDPLTQLEDEDVVKNETATIEELIAELPRPTITAAEFINAVPGRFSGKRYDDLSSEEQTEIVNILKELPQVGDQPTEQEMELYWRKSLSLFHEDYPNPADALDDVNIEAFGSPEIEDERYQFKEQLNVEIILDASGSMGNVIDGKTMMDIAKESINEFAASLPEGTNMALRIYGHEGTGANKDKELSCKSNELIYEMQSFDQNLLNQALNGVKPAGWTPLANAIELAKNDLSQYDSESNTNIVYLVSDGIETCNGDPVAKAKELAESAIQPIVNVIGFDLDAKGQQQMKEVAEAAKGIYNNARNQEELKQELQKAKMIAEKWQAWKKDATYTVQMNRNDQFLKNIPSFNIEWSEANGNEDMNILQPLRALRDEGHISKAAFQLLSDKSSERFSKAIELGKQIELDLRNIADQNLETAKEEINKKYDSNIE